MENTVGVVFAAGKGTRMNSNRLKVLHKVCGYPMVYYPIRSLKYLKVKDIYVVSGYGRKDLEEALSGEKVNFVQQDNLLGTADALKQFFNKIDVSKYEHIIVLYGDFPLITSDMLREQMEYHLKENEDCTIGSMIPDDMKYYIDNGRIIRDNNENFLGVKEVDELGSSIENHKEVNLGVYCFKYFAKLGTILNKIKPFESGEFYLTDIFELLKKHKFKVDCFKYNSALELIGVNDQKAVSEVNKIMRAKIIEGLMEKGVAFIDPDNTYLESGVMIGRDSVIYPNVVIEKDVKVGKNCIIGPSSRLRTGTILEDDIEIGNFVEVNRSHIKNKVKIKHFSYIGDATVEENVNIGAGTITANYDGKNKNKTLIKKNAFIGSGTILVAPVVVGEEATTGAGTVIPKNKNVSDKATVVGVPAKKIEKDS